MTGIESGKITLITFTDGRIAEIMVNPVVEPVSAAKLVRAMAVRGVTCAKIVRTTQTAKEIPPPRFDQEGGGQSTP